VLESEMKSAEEADRTTPGGASAGPQGNALEHYRMEEVVKRTGLTPRAIRYYEEMGLLSPSGRTAGGFRLFTEAEITLLLRIKELQTLLGFSLAEIKDILDADAVRAEIRLAYQHTTDPGTRVGLLDQAVGLVESQLRVISERMARLKKLDDELQGRLARLRGLREQVFQTQAPSLQVSGDGEARDEARDGR
jgi:DNA-binding transcriptional MerR regulator